MRNIVRRADGRRVHVQRALGHLFVCADGCCCGRTQDGFPPVPREVFHAEWERRNLRGRVHLTIGGCLGPCALANVVMLLFEGRQAFFHSIDSEAEVLALYDYVEQLADAGAYAPPPPALAGYQFTASTWEGRPDGRPVDDLHLRRPGAAQGRATAPPEVPGRAGNAGETAEVRREPAAPPREVTVGGNAAETAITPDSVVAGMEGLAAVPRKNGELVFEAPWEGRVFGMAIALYDERRYGWEEFQRRLIAEIASAEARGESSGYYERWLRSFEGLLAEKGILTREELDDRTEAFEFGERDEVY